MDRKSKMKIQGADQSDQVSETESLRRPHFVDRPQAPRFPPPPIPPPEALSSDPANIDVNNFIVTAAKRYRAKNAKEMSLEEGDTLLVLNNEKTWWKVRNQTHDGAGYVPKTHLALPDGQSCDTVVLPLIREEVIVHGFPPGPPNPSNMSFPPPMQNSASFLQYPPMGQNMMGQGMPYGMGMGLPYGVLQSQSLLNLPPSLTDANRVFKTSGTSLYLRPESTPMDVQDWLGQEGLGKLGPIFSGVNGGRLLGLSRDDVRRSVPTML